MKKSNEVHKPEGKVFLISDTHFDHENTWRTRGSPVQVKLRFTMYHKVLQQAFQVER